MNLLEAGQRREVVGGQAHDLELGAALTRGTARAPVGR
jgi:hypothetical protein